MMFASSLAVLADAFPGAAERAKAFAAYGATIGASFAFGPLVGGALTSYVSWRAVFFVNVPLGLLTIAPTYACVRESKESHARRLDIPGQMTLTGGLFLLVFAPRWSASNSPTGTTRSPVKLGHRSHSRRLRPRQRKARRALPHLSAALIEHQRGHQV